MRFEYLRQDLECALTGLASPSTPGHQYVGFLELEPYTPRTRYLPPSSKYRRDTAVANANVVLVRLICDGSGPGYITSWLVLL